MYATKVSQDSTRSEHDRSKNSDPPCYRSRERTLSSALERMFQVALERETQHRITEAANRDFDANWGSF